MNWTSARTISTMILFMFLVYAGSPSESLFAATRYVSDKLIISVRAGQNNESEVLGHIKSDTPVDILEEEGRYLRIRTEYGLEGWVNAKYITSKQPDALIIKNLHDEIMHLQGRIETCENKAINSESIASVKLNYEQKIAGLERIIKTRQQMLSNKDNELEKLRKENVTLKSKRSHLENPNKSAVKLKSIHWFLAGAGVLLFGFIIGRSARKDKRTSIYR